MRIQIEPTNIFLTLDGVKARVWNGITDEGVQCFVFASMVAVRAGDDPLHLAEALTTRQIPEGFEEESMRYMR